MTFCQEQSYSTESKDDRSSREQRVHAPNLLNPLCTLGNICLHLRPAGGRFISLMWASHTLPTTAGCAVVRQPCDLQHWHTHTQPLSEVSRVGATYSILGLCEEIINIGYILPNILLKYYDTQWQRETFPTDKICCLFYAYTFLQLFLPASI